MNRTRVRKMTRQMTIRTWLLVDDEFLDVESFVGPIKDPDYIEGAIELVIDGTELLTTRMWDYVDQLWAYILDGAAKVAEGKNASTFFPDQPIELKLDPIGESARVTVVCDDEVSASVDRRHFLSEIVREAEIFFRKLEHLLPSRYDHELECIEQLKRTLNA